MNKPAPRCRDLGYFDVCTCRASWERGLTETKHRKRPNGMSGDLHEPVQPRFWKKCGPLSGSDDSIVWFLVETRERPGAHGTPTHRDPTETHRTLHGNPRYTVGNQNSSREIPRDPMAYCGLPQGFHQRFSRGPTGVHVVRGMGCRGPPRHILPDDIHIV